MVIEAIKNTLPLEVVLRDAGINLKHGKARCPFHEDRNPSFSVKGERWRCFAGCGGGDVLDFVKKFHNLDTGAAIRHLAKRAGLDNGPLTPAERQAAQEARQERERKKALIKDFRQWEQRQVDTLAAVLRGFYEKQSEGFTPEELDIWSPMIREMAYLEYLYFDVLCSREDGPKLDLYEQEMLNGSHRTA